MKAHRVVRRRGSHIFKTIGSQLTRDYFSNSPRIIIEFGKHMKLVRLIEMCLNKTYSKVRIGKHLSDTFPIQNGLQQGDASLPLLLNFVLEYFIRKV
jgi:hypothetical protein